MVRAVELLLDSQARPLRGEVGVEMEVSREKVVGILRQGYGDVS